MGIYCNYLIQPLIPSPNDYGHDVTAEILFCLVNDQDGLLDENEKSLLKEFFRHTLLGNGLLCLPTVIMNMEEGTDRSLKVYIDGITPQYDPSIKYEHPVEPFRTDDGRVLLLGEYLMKQKTIVLYINNIRYCAAEIDTLSSSLLLLSVFTHELYHAYYNKDIYEPLIEEPFAEFGALLYMNRLFPDFISKKNNRVTCFDGGEEIPD